MTHATSSSLGPANGAEESAQYLTFTLGEEVFAMDIRTVRETGRSAQAA